MTHFQLPASTKMGAVHLNVANLEDMTRFYHEVIGLQVLSDKEETVTLGTSEMDLVTLHALPRGQHILRATGLFHLAILLPSRTDLAHWLSHFASTGYPLQGASDHLVSEALYLGDPEGNGIEIYRDRPRNEWVYAGDQVAMSTEWLDLNRLLAEAPQTAWQGMPAASTMGHVHLKVDALPSARHFYVDTLGFDLMQDSYPGALFVSAGGYHHHLGLNIWQSKGADPLPADALGLYGYTVQLPTARDLEVIKARLEGLNVFMDGENGQVWVWDSAGNRLFLEAIQV